MKYALDSNIISYALRGNKDIEDRLFSENQINSSFIIPAMVYFEVKRGLLRLNSIRKLEAFEFLCENFGVGEFDFEVWKKAAEIHNYLAAKGQPIDDGDILIGAYCIVNDYTLVTNNAAHFVRIEGLNFINWLD